MHLPTNDREQEEIARILDELFDKEQQTKEAAEIVLDQIELMKKSILARSFRGELDTNDPNEESNCQTPIKSCAPICFYTDSNVH